MRRSGGWPRLTSSSPPRRVRTSNRPGPRPRRWESRFADLLDEDPGIEADLRAVVEEIAAQVPAGVVSAADHAVAAGRDVNISAIAAGLLPG